MAHGKSRTLNLEHFTDNELDQKAYDWALKSLNMSACSSGKMRIKLLERGFPEAVVERAVEKLEEQRFLDDVEYARSITRHEVLFNCRSKKLARMKLRSLNVDECVIQGALEDIADVEVLRAQTEYIDNAIVRILQNLEVQGLEGESRSSTLMREYRRLLGKAGRKGLEYELVTQRWHEVVGENFYASP